MTSDSAIGMRLAPRPAVAKPNLEHFFTLTNSPYIQIYVSDKKEPYKLPSALLAYYSPYIRHCLATNNKDIELNGLQLPDADPQFFEAMVDYMRRGAAAVLPVDHNLDEWSQVKRIFAFNKLCDRLDVAEAACITAEHLGYIYDSGEVFLDESKEDWMFAFDRLHNSSPALKTIASFLAKMLCDQDTKSRSWTEEFLKTNEKAAAEVMKAYLQMTTYEKGKRYIKEDVGSFDGDDEVYDA